LAVLTSEVTLLNTLNDSVTAQRPMTRFARVGTSPACFYRALCTAAIAARGVAVITLLGTFYAAVAADCKQSRLTTGGDVRRTLPACSRASRSGSGVAISKFDVGVATEDQKS